MFLGGILFVQCYQIRSCVNLYRLILRQVLKFHDKSDQERQKVIAELCSEVQIKDYLKDFLNDKHSE